MSDNRPNRPPGWRPEWRDPRPRKGAERKDDDLAEGMGVASDPLPSAAVLRDEMIRNLRSLATDPRASSVARVAAARTLLEMTQSSQMEELSVAVLTDEQLEQRRRQVAEAVLGVPLLGKGDDDVDE